VGKKDPRVDAYISRSADFAKPVLTRIRDLVHSGCPDVEETLKWGFPHFIHKGILCSMAAFKSHCAFGFWKASLIPSVKNEGKSREAMGQLGRITSISDLPKEKMFLRNIQEAVKLNDAGIKTAPKVQRKKKDLEIPEYLAVAIVKNKKALAAFERFSYTNKKEYVDWVTQAKTENTRKKRLETAVKWMSQGKIRNWKYV
jgi:uncharacterized protein YdeI (YjbR/CyaY-like superfamily)